jgi:ParB/RepB/Spo0J family partition protein
MSDLGYKHIPLNEIEADEKFNCRGTIATIDVVELAADIKEKGLLQPVIVTEYSTPVKGKKYRLIGGFRRYAAHQVNQAETIWATIMPEMDEQTATVMNLSENLNRLDLSFSQEAKALARLRDLGVSRQDTAKRLNRKDGWVQLRYMFLDLPPIIQAEVDAGIIKQTDIRNLITVKKHLGVNKCIERAKLLKEAKERGVKINIKPRNVKAKKARSKVEMTEMLNVIYTQVGPCLGARALAWANGEVTDLELFEAIKEECEIVGKAFIQPWE